MAEAVDLIDHAIVSIPIQVVPDHTGLYNWAPRPALYETAKRTIDVALSLVVLFGLLPVWVVIAVIVLVSSPGPVLHSGIVVGRGGRRFTWFKFRTMYVTDDTIHREWIRDYVCEDRPYREGVFKVTPDPRVTRMGAWLRRFSLDEIPQFINVLKGDMSVVGPRPPVEYEFEHYNVFAMRRLAVRPGITGLHQVTGRGRASFSAMLATDVEYIEGRSLRNDLSIMLRTLRVMVTGEGAA